MTRGPLRPRSAFPLARFARPTSGERSTEGAGRRALVVEDDPDVAGAFAECLRLYSIDAEEAPNGAAALAAAGRGSLDLAFVDLGLPDQPGSGVGERLRALQPAVVLVALTGWSDWTELDRCFALGFDCYVVKPIRMELVEELLALADARRPRASA